MNGAHDAATAPVIVMLAAGEGRRFGDIKQLADIAGEPMCRRVARQLLGMGCPLVVVTGAHAPEVEKALAELPLETVHNGQWDQGMGRSIACGARHVQRNHGDSTSLLVCLADQPLIEPAHFRRMLERHHAVPGHLLGTRHGGVTGPPVLFPGDCLGDLATWNDSRGAHALLEREADRLEHLDVAEHPDVDTPADLERVRNAWRDPGSTGAC